MNNDILNTFAQMLENDGFGTVGTDIFIGQIPAELNGIYLERIGGTMNLYLPLEESTINLYVQNISSETAIQTIESIKRTYHRHLETGDDDSFIYTILAIADIEDMGRDMDFGKVYKISFAFQHRSRALIS